MGTDDFPISDDPLSHLIGSIESGDCNASVKHDEIIYSEGNPSDAGRTNKEKMLGIAGLGDGTDPEGSVNHDAIYSASPNSPSMES